MTTTHTPATRAYGIPNEPRVYGCGCQAHISHIKHCPTHAQAPAMLAALRGLIYASDQCQGHKDCGHAMTPWQDARAILRTVEG